MHALANTILILHTLYVATVVLSVPLILLGGWLGWAWVRNIWFRGFHLLMIAIVAMEALLGVRCPLTVWENAARAKASPLPGQHNIDQDFIAAWLDRLLFYHFSHTVFTALYVGFAALVLSLLFLVPVKIGRQITAM